MIDTAQEMLIKCYNGLDQTTPAQTSSGRVELFFALSSDLGNFYPDFRQLSSEKELARAGKFLSDSERETYLACHAMLRLILSERIGVNPEEVSYAAGVYNKPGLQGDSLFFNISHTKKAFAIAVSSTGALGLDIEDIDRKVDIDSVTGSYFSDKELEFTMESDSGTEERFFMLWTRKEALLKAMGTGIIDDLRQVEVSGEENYVNADLFNKNYCRASIIRDYFIYSKLLGRHYLSLAMPYPQPISFTQLDEINIKSYLA